MTYKQWMEIVDQEVSMLAFCSANDLVDWGFYNAFEDGASPTEAAREALRYSGFPMDLLDQPTVYA